MRHKRPTRFLRACSAWCLAGMTAAAWAAPAAGQTPAASRSQTSTGSSGAQTAAGTTVSGDTGLWVVPTADTLPQRAWSISFSRVNQHDGQGFSDVSTFPAALAIGLPHHVELFGNWAVAARLDRDTNPLFFTSTAAEAATGTGGGILLNYPFDRKTWSGNTRGDARLGAKVALLSEDDGHGASVAVRAIVKLPAGSQTAGASSGQTDFSADAVVSKRLSAAEITAFGGIMVRGNPAGFTLTNGLRWGAGAGIPIGRDRSVVFSAEAFGERYFNSTITAPAGLTAPDGSIVPTSTSLKSPASVELGVTWQASNGFFIGGAGEWSFTMSSRSQATPVGLPGFADRSGDGKGYEIRFGFRPGGRSSARSGGAVGSGATAGGGAAAGSGVSGAGGAGAATGAGRGAAGVGAGAASAGAGAAGSSGAAGTTGAGGATTSGAASTAGAAGTGGGAAGAGGGSGTGAAGTGTGGAGTSGAGAAAGAAGGSLARTNHAPTVRVSCDPCSVEPGRTIVISADAQDPDGDPLTYQWTAASGTFANARSRQTTWTAPSAIGPVRVSIAVDDGHGATATDAVTVQVVAAAVKTLTFEEVHFDFDKSAIRPDAKRILDAMVETLKANPSVQIQIEGHTCNIGTKEYNLALGDRRAKSVKNYLVAHGISADRLTTISYGEERPKYDNNQFETRKLNRRAEFVVKIQ